MASKRPNNEVTHVISPSKRESKTTKISHNAPQYINNNLIGGFLRIEDLFLLHNQNGGDVNTIIKTMDISTNNILVNQAKSREFTFINNNQKLENKFPYFSKGNNTAVYQIVKKVDRDNLLSDNPMILKIVTSHFRNLLDTYITDLQSAQIKPYLMTIHQLGRLFVQKGLFAEKIGYYMICKKYYRSDDIMRLPYSEKIELILQLIDLLIYLESVNLFLYDLKLDNIGYSITQEGKKQLKIIDYDTNTFKYLKPILSDPSNNHVYLTKQTMYGSLVPPYMVESILTDTPENMVRKIDKLHSFSLIITILYILSNEIQIADFISFVRQTFDPNNDYKVKIDLAKYHELRNEYNRNGHILNQVNQYNLKYQRIGKIFMGLLHPNYDKIMSLQEVKTILSEELETLKRLESASAQGLNKYLKYGNSEAISLEQVFRKKYLLYKTKYLALKKLFI
jgi:hypothetical protein